MTVEQKKKLISEIQTVIADVVFDNSIDEMNMDIHVSVSDGWVKVTEIK